LREIKINASRKLRCLNTSNSIYRSRFKSRDKEEVLTQLVCPRLQAKELHTTTVKVLKVAPMIRIQVRETVVLPVISPPISQCRFRYNKSNRFRLCSSFSNNELID
jgi:hypothetical protein